MTLKYLENGSFYLISLKSQKKSEFVTLVKVTGKTVNNSFKKHIKNISLFIIFLFVLTFYGIFCKISRDYNKFHLIFLTFFSRGC